MNRIIKISCLITYLLFALVYPIIHFHAQEHHDEIEIRLSIHPPELISDKHSHDHEHSDEHKHTDGHKHDDTHFAGDWDYTLQINSFSFKISEKQLFEVEILDEEHQVLSRKPQDIPLKLPPGFRLLNISERAPPILT